MKLSSLLTVVFLSSQIFAASPKVVYGEDNREDVYNSYDRLHVELAKSTVAMIRKFSIVKSGNAALITAPTLEDRGICKEDRFSEQITAADCSGFLVGEDLVVTAGHCVSRGQCGTHDWVFDFSNKTSNTGNSVITLSSDDVYSCKKVISSKLESSTGNDFALIKLDRPVVGRTPLAFRKSGKIETGSELVVIGHPTGLPTKISGGSQVVKNDNDIFFLANLDTFQGNSGSAVFDAKTGMVEGILVRGENDYDVVKGSDGSYCRTPKVCLQDGSNCRGEDVTRITNIQELVASVK